MKNIYSIFICAIMAIMVSSCSKDEVKTNPTTPPVVVDPPVIVPDVLTTTNVKTYMVDPNATAETVALFYNLKKLGKTKFAIGQQDALNYFYNNDSGTTDIKKATGFDPVILGSDFERITAKENTGIDGNWWYGEQKKIIADTKEAYAKGMVNIFCWHVREPFNENSFYAKDLTATEKTTAFKSILPGGSNHDWYKGKLDKIAAVVANLKGANGELIPIIFRPFHEFDGNWFWWGASYCTPDDYKIAFKFTVDYLKNTKGLHNILYSFSPDNSYTTESGYLSRYPGDSYVDVLGMDNYGDLASGRGQTGSDLANNKLKYMSEYAISKVKIAAMTETGWQVTTTTAPVSGWFSNYLYNTLTANNIQISFVMFWNNGNYKDTGSAKSNYYVPVPGTSNVSDFAGFATKPKAALLNSIPKMYVLPQ